MQAIGNGITVRSAVVLRFEAGRVEGAGVGLGVRAG